MMADKTTPGGVLHDPVNGGRLDEPSAVNLEARLREASAQATATLDAVKAVEVKVEALATLPPGGVAGDFLTRTATGHAWKPPIMDLGDVIVDVSGLYFIDNGDGTSTPVHPELFVDHADGTSTLKGA